MSVAFFRTQLRRLQALAGEEPISLERREQELVGALLQWGQHGSVRFEEIEFSDFRAAMA